MARAADLFYADLMGEPVRESWPRSPAAPSVLPGVSWQPAPAPAVQPVPAPILVVEQAPVIEAGEGIEMADAWGAAESQATEDESVAALGVGQAWEAEAPVVAEDVGLVEVTYSPADVRSYTPSADPSLFHTAPVPVAVSPATEWPEATNDPDGAASRALQAAGATAATVTAYAGGGLAALRPIAALFGELALVELLRRLRYTPAQLASPPHSYDSDADLCAAFRVSNRAAFARQTVLAIRLLLAIPGHFRELARRAGSDQEAFAVESLGWLIMHSLRDDVASACGLDFWLPSGPAFVAPFTNPLPQLSDQTTRFILRSGFIDDTQDLALHRGRLAAWRTGPAGRMWRLETGREPATRRPGGAPFYPEPFTIPALINTSAQRAQVRAAWARRVTAFQNGTSTVPLTTCNRESDAAFLAPLGLMAPVSLRPLELCSHFPQPRRSGPLTSLQGLAVARPAFEAAFLALASVGWNDLLFETQGLACFRGKKIPGSPNAARTMSEHGLGIAIDLNVFENGQNTTGSMDPRVVALFEAFRFRWGKGFSTPDPMHFEYSG